jgi:simple sugar transport system substrate-binding protein
MGFWAGNYLASVGRGDEEINAVVLEGTTGATAATERTNGINEALTNFPNIKIVASQTGNFTRAEGQAVMESFLKSQPDIDLLFAENDDHGPGRAIAAIKAAGKVPGKDIIVVGCDSVKAAFDAIVAGEMNATIECTPLYSPFVVQAIKDLEEGKTFGREVLHPRSSSMTRTAAIAYTADGDKLSIKAADVIADRKY